MTKRPLIQSPFEDVQKFWDHRPCNILHSAQPIDTKEYSDEVETRRYSAESRIPGFAQIDNWEEKKALGESVRLAASMSSCVRISDVVIITTA